MEALSFKVSRHQKLINLNNNLNVQHIKHFSRKKTLTAVSGTVLGFSAILLPQLEKEQPLTEDDKSWIASLSNIGNVHSCSF